MTAVLTTKYCPKCQQTLDLDMFGPNKYRKDGLQSYCTPCRKGYYHEEKAKDPTKHYLRSKKWRETNKEYKAQKDREWAEKNREKTREYKRRWKENHKEQNRQINKEYCLKNKEIRSIKNREWRKNNPEKHRLKEARRRARKRQNGIFEVSDKEVKRMLQKPCFYCGGKSEHIEHIIPIARGGAHSIGNLVQSCGDCNWSKNSRLIVEWKRMKNDR